MRPPPTAINFDQPCADTFVSGATSVSATQEQGWRPVPPPAARRPSPRKAACGWGCAPRGRRPHFPAMVPAHPPLEAMTAPARLATEVCGQAARVIHPLRRPYPFHDAPPAVPLLHAAQREPHRRGPARTAAQDQEHGWRFARLTNAGGQFRRTAARCPSRRPPACGWPTESATRRSPRPGIRLPRRRPLREAMTTPERRVLEVCVAQAARDTPSGPGLTDPREPAAVKSRRIPGGRLRFSNPIR